MPNTRKIMLCPPQTVIRSAVTKCVISAGYSRSSEVDFTVTSLDDFQEGTTYCMPVSIERIENSGLAVLEPSRTLFIVLKLRLSVRLSTSDQVTFIKCRRFRKTPILLHSKP